MSGTETTTTTCPVDEKKPAKAEDSPSSWPASSEVQVKSILLPSEPTGESPPERFGQESNDSTPPESLSDYDHLIVLPHTPGLHELHTILRDRNTTNSDFVFHADRLIRIIVEEGLEQLPMTKHVVTTTNGGTFEGLKYLRGNCAISLSRSGEAMETAVRQCCRSMRIGKVLVNDKNRVVVTRLPPDIATRRVLLLYPLLHTGSALIEALHVLTKIGVQEENIFLLSLFSTFRGVRRVHRRFPHVITITSEIDDDNLPYHFTTRYFGTD